MKPSLLATKLRVPPQPHYAVHRARLIAALERRIPHYKFVLIAAAAGYGKTTLLSQWAHASDYPVAWLSISEEDNDLEHFFRYLLVSWSEIQPSVIESPLGLLLGSMLPDSHAVLSAFINFANDVPNHFVFVLDDYHLIEDPSIHQALTFLLDHLPPTLHFVLAGRAEPPLPLARYRARRELSEFGAEDLQFLQKETADFLNEMMGLDLGHDEVLRLQTQLEGWVAGLQLVALTLQRRLTGTDKLLVSGRHRFIADYLSEDVLAPLPDNMRRFLLQTSILDRLSGALCDAVTEAEGSQELLERLGRENLFLVPLDDSREWFRFHRLFADFLQEELKRRHPDEIAPVHRRAARWYLAQDLPEPAFHHAVVGDDLELVSRILEHYVNLKLNCGEVKVVARWLDSLPAAWYAANPVLDLARAGLLAFTGAFDACLRCIDDVEQRLAPVESKDARWQLAMVRAVQCFMACIQNDLARAEMYADEASEDLREESLSFRASIYHALGDTYRRNGRWDEAKECYLRVPSLLDTPGFRVQSRVQGVHVFGALADLELQRGRLHNAADYWRKALAAIREPETWGRLELPVIGWVFIRMAEILYEWNELGEAGDHLSQGLERAELGGDPQAIIAGYLLAGRLKLTAGDTAAAAKFLDQARPLIENAPFPDWIGRFGRFQLEVWLAQDRLRAAVSWADEMLQGDTLKAPLESEEVQLAMARVLIIKGDASSIDRALALLRQLLQAAEAEGRTGIVIETLALQALAQWRRGDPASAMTTLERALRLAEPEGYLRLFADLGLPMGRLLQEARSRAVMPDAVAKLLATFAGDLAVPASVSETLPEPLSQREQEVLQCIAAGLTNREIAETLVISPETVKKHTSSIFGKLGVRSRTAAVTRARELDLLR